MVGAVDWRAVAPGSNPAYRLANIRASTLAGLVEAARARGGEPERWFAARGLKTTVCLDPDARLSFADVSAVLHQAVREFPDVALGLDAGARLTLPSLGLLGFSLMAAPDIASAAVTGQKFHPAAGSLTDVRCFVTGGEFVLEAVERYAEPALHRFLCEKLFASVLVTTRALLGNDHRPLYVELRYAAPACAAEYRRFFGCPVRFGASSDRLVSEASILQRSIATRSAAAHAESLRLLRTRVPETDDDPVAALRDWLRLRLGQTPRISDAARELQLGERTLRRRLAAARSSFRALHDELRAERARLLLADPQRSVATVAAELGYSDERELRRAHKRWTGRAPRGRSLPAG
ncbi:MAG: AraC family transcriptional regulator ligand-binding domain-containing protein [Myxococcota bacterium]